MDSRLLYGTRGLWRATPGLFTRRSRIVCSNSDSCRVQRWGTRWDVYTRRGIHVFRDVPELRSYRKGLRDQSRSVGLVPTMGALHEGHMSLVRQAATENTDVFVTIYVNPTQFGVNEDLDKYPKTWENDMQKLSQLDNELAGRTAAGRITAVFAPTTKAMYPTLSPTSEVNGHGSFVTITPIASYLEGRSRPVFFRGVATVCMKLFNIVQPDRVYFGQKDVQQTVVIRRMVKDFHLDVEVKIGPTSREPSGLAMSSRNVYLGERRRKTAVMLSQALIAAQRAFVQGNARDREAILDPANDLIANQARRQIEAPTGSATPFELDYISLADPTTLEEIEHVDDTVGAILSGAVKMLPITDLQPGEDGGLGDGRIPVRLIDNVILLPVQP